MTEPVTDEQLEEIGHRFVDVNGDLGVGHLVAERDRMREGNAKYLDVLDALAFSLSVAHDRAMRLRVYADEGKELRKVVDALVNVEKVYVGEDGPMSGVDALCNFRSVAQAALRKLKEAR